MPGSDGVQSVHSCRQRRQDIRNPGAIQAQRLIQLQIPRSHVQAHGVNTGSIHLKSLSDPASLFARTNTGAHSSLCGYGHRSRNRPDPGIEGQNTMLRFHDEPPASDAGYRESRAGSRQSITRCLFRNRAYQSYVPNEKTERSHCLLVLCGPLVWPRRRQLPGRPYPVARCYRHPDKEVSRSR